MHCLSIVSPHARELVFKIPLFYNIRCFGAKQTILHQNIRLTDIFANVYRNLIKHFSKLFCHGNIKFALQNTLATQNDSFKNAKETKKKIMGFSKRGSLTISFHGVFM